MSDDDRTRLASLMSARELADGDVLVREGAPDEHLYVVVQGRLAVKRPAELGETTTVTVLTAGDLAGELGFIDGTPRHSSLVASGPTRVLGLTRGTLEREVDAHPRLVWQVLCAILRRVHETQRRLSLQALELSNYVFKQHGRY
jgi:CRP-like cAMP-binding protein